MPYDPSGNFTRDYNFVDDRDNGIKVLASRMDGEFDNYATALNEVLLRNGVAAMTGDLNLGGFSVVGLEDGVVAIPAVRFQNSVTTGLYSPAVDKVALTAAGTNRVEANTTGVILTGTLNVSGAATFASTLGVTGAASSASLGVTGTAGAGFLNLIAQSVAPAAAAAGNLRLHAETTQGFTRILQDNEGTTNLVLGRDNCIIARNTSGGTLNKGTVVYVSGSTGNVPTVSAARANAAATMPALGVLVDNIANNAFGQVMTVGIISGFDTSAFATGVALYVSDSVAGALTATRPSGTTNIVQAIATVLVSGVGNGSVKVAVAPGLLNIETGTNAATWTGRAIVGTSLTTSLDSTINTVAIGLGASSVATNVGVGFGTLTANTSGNTGVAVGYEALKAQTTAAGNVAIGYRAGLVTTTGATNVYVGSSAGAANVSASNLVAIGSNAALVSTVGNMVAIGGSALAANTTGSGNTAIGYLALSTNISGTNCTGVGTQSLTASTGGQNTAVGWRSMFGNTTGIRNIAVGDSALLANTSGGNNVALGSGALQANTTASFNIGIGYQALNANTTGASNTGIGYQVLDDNTTGASNTGIGASALGANTTGTFNTGVGASALTTNTIGTHNVAVGYYALRFNLDGTYNTGLGHLALTANTTGIENTAVGYGALKANTTGGNNIAVGTNALDLNTTGSNNIAIGIGVDCDSATASNQMNIGGIYRHNRLVHTPATLATLNAFTGLATGTRAICSDSTTVVFNATVTGGGGNTVPVWYNGANWIVG